MTGNRFEATPTEGDPLKIRIFYAYAAKDQAYQEALEKQLAILRQTGSVEEWHDRKIPVGEYRDKHIRKELVRADIILLLLSPDFLASDYHFSTEIAFACQAQEAGLTTVIPILIRESDWKNTPLSKLQPLPRNGRSIAKNTAAAPSGPQYEDLRDEEWQKIADETTQIVGQLLVSPEDLLTKRQMRLALEMEESSKAPQSGFSNVKHIPERKPTPIPVLLGAIVVLLVIGGGVLFELHGMPGESTHGSPFTTLSTSSAQAGAIATATHEATPIATHTVGETAIVSTPVHTLQGPFSETTGGEAQTWTDYTNAGGYQGLTIPSQRTVQITCKVTGLKVQDGDTWWYRIASSPWNNKYYVSADAFYNNGSTTDFAHSLPVDDKIPNC